jgi:acetylornithine deacetylase/succinyl-diaminopimelate desuccinylase-like protein
MKKLFLSILCIGGLYLIVPAQDSTTARDHIKYLSSIELHGRGVAYEGEHLAADYIINNLANCGVEPLAEEYVQKYEHAGFIMEGEVKCNVGPQELVAGEDYRILPFSKPLHGEYTLIHVNPSDLINNKKIKAINKKYANISDHSLIYIDESQVNFKNDKEAELYKKACAKSEYINPFNSQGIIRNLKTRMVWGLANTDFERPLAYIYMNTDKINSKTRSIEFYYENKLADFTHLNVCGIIKGTEHPEQYIVLTCHYDHLGAMGDKVYYPGAHDNASGCAFVLNMAKYLQEHPCRYSVVFLFFSGEESGLLGSKYFTEHPLIPLSDIKYLINFDLLGGGDEGIMLVNSTEGEGLQIYKRLMEINDDGQLVPKIAQRSNAPNSDHYFFTQHKVPAIFLYTMGGKVGAYHDISDTNENCSLTMFDNIFRLFTTLLDKEE